MNTAIANHESEILGIHHVLRPRANSYLAEAENLISAETLRWRKEWTNPNEGGGEILGMMKSCIASASSKYLLGCEAIHTCSERRNTLLTTWRPVPMRDMT